MAFCTQCGKPVLDQSKFCTSCGKPLDIPSNQSISPPEAVFPQNTQTQATYSQNTQAQATYPQNTQAQATYPQNTQSQATYPQNTQAQATYPQNTQSQATYPQNKQAQATHTQYAPPQSPYPQYTAPKQNTSYSPPSFNVPQPNQGYSPKIQLPVFEEFAKKQGKFAFIFLAVVAAIALIAILIFVKDQLSTVLLAYLAAVGATLLFTVIGRAKLNQTWDGVIENKKIIVKVDNNQDDTIVHQKRKIPTLYIRLSNGRKKKMQLQSMAIYDFYQIGDSLRKHKGFTLPEKLVKDTRLICIYDGTFSDYSLDICPKCKLPLLK